MDHRVDETIVFHDSCYLGRYNDVYDPPRELLKGIPGVKLVEMARNREEGMCCGAGGGLMWMEEHVGNRINVARTEQAIATQASVISSGCPYCLTMLSDGTKAKEVEETIGTYDIAELLERAVFGTPQAAPVEEAQEEVALTEVVVEQPNVEVQPEPVAEEAVTVQEPAEGSVDETKKEH